MVAMVIMAKMKILVSLIHLFFPILSLALPELAAKTTSLLDANFGAVTSFVFPSRGAACHLGECLMALGPLAGDHTHGIKLKYFNH